MDGKIILDGIVYTRESILTKTLPDGVAIVFDHANEIFTITITDNVTLRSIECDKKLIIRGKMYVNDRATVSIDRFANGIGSWTGGGISWREGIVWDNWTTYPNVVMAGRTILTFTNCNNAFENV